MKTLITSALIAATAMGVASAASAGTYRLDVSADTGIQLAPIGTGQVALEQDAPSAGLIKVQAITGKPVVALEGSNNSVFIIEAEEGDVLLLTAMQANSMDTIGQARVVIPSAVVTEETRQTIKTMEPRGTVDGERVFSEVTTEFVTEATNTPAQRISGAVIKGFDAGADEGRDTLEETGNLGYVKVTRMSK